MKDKDGFYVVTGGAGFIGTNLTARLVYSGLRTKVIDNFSTGRRENLASLEQNYGHALQVVEGDIRDLDFLQREFSHSQGIFHLAAIPSVEQSVREPLLCHEVNVTGTLNTFLAARDQGVPRVVFASSCAIYGDSEVLPKVEDMPDLCLSPYAAHKATGEQYARLFYSLYGLKTFCLRYFNVYGPRQDPKSDYAAAIPRFIQRMLAAEPPILFGDGQQTRDFIYVGDIVQANLAALKAEAGFGEVFNIGTGKSRSLNELVSSLNQILGTSLAAQHAAPRPGDVRHSSALVDKAFRLLHFRSEMDFAEGLRHTLQWFQGKKELHQYV